MDVPYSATLEANSGALPYEWAIISHEGLPAGLSLDPYTGEISGTPEDPSESIFMVEVTDSIGATAAGEVQLTINAPPEIATGWSTSGEGDLPNLPDGVVNIPYPNPNDPNETLTLQANFGTGSYTWEMVNGPGLPDGLTLESDGTIWGTPTKATRGNGQPKKLAIKVTDEVGATSILELTITIRKR